MFFCHVLANLFFLIFFQSQVLNFSTSDTESEEELEEVFQRVSRKSAEIDRRRGEKRMFFFKKEEEKGKEKEVASEMSLEEVEEGGMQEGSEVWFSDEVLSSHQHSIG